MRCAYALRLRGGDARLLVTAIERRDTARFLTTALSYPGRVRRTHERLGAGAFRGGATGLLWRDWLTRGLVRQCLSDRAYLRVRERGELGNPDQRIADDAGAFTGSALSFLLIFINAGFAIVGDGLHDPLTRRPPRYRPGLGISRAVSGASGSS